MGRCSRVDLSWGAFGQGIVLSVLSFEFGALPLDSDHRAAASPKCLHLQIKRTELRLCGFSDFYHVEIIGCEIFILNNVDIYFSHSRLELGNGVSQGTLPTDYSQMSDGGLPYD